METKITAIAKYNRLTNDWEVVFSDGHTLSGFGRGGKVSAKFKAEQYNRRK